MHFYLVIFLLGITVSLFGPSGKDAPWWTYFCFSALIFIVHQVAIIPFQKKIDQMADDLFDLKKGMGLIDGEGFIDRELTTKYQKHYYLRNKVWWHIYWDLVSEQDWKATFKENYSFTERQEAAEIARGMFSERNNELSIIKECIEKDQRSTNEILKELKGEWEYAENEKSLSAGKLIEIRRNYNWKYTLTKKISSELKDGKKYNPKWSPREYYLTVSM